MNTQHQLINRIFNESVVTSIAIFTLIFFLFGCQPQEKSEWESFGAQISSDEAVSTAELLTEVSSPDSVQVKFEGEIEEVCQMKGCWMTLKTEDGTSVRVTFKDYGFFVPKDAGGKKVIIEGMAVLSELDEATAMHYAEDAGKTYEPGSSNRELSVVASGVLIDKTTVQL